MANKPKTKKVTHTSWNTLDAGTRKRALQFVLGPTFRDWMVADSLNKDFIFWDVIERCVRLTVGDKYYKTVINNTMYVQ